MDHKLVAVCLKTSKQVEIVKKAGGKIIDHKCLPGGRVVLLTSDGWIISHIYDIDSGFVQMDSIFKIDILKNLKEAKCENLAICPKYKFLAVHTTKMDEKASRILIFKLKEGKFEYFNQVIFQEENIDKICALTFFGYSGEYLILTGISYSDIEPIVFTFEILKESVREAKELRKIIKANKPRKLTKIGDELMSIDGRGKVVRVWYQGWINSV